MTSNDATPGGPADVIRAFLQAEDAHDVPAQLRCLADDIVYEDVAMGFRKEGPAEVEAVLRALEDNVSTDFRIDLGAVVASGDGYAAEWTMTGTNDRALAAYGLPATGRTFVLPGVSVGSVRDGRIVHNRDYWDLAGLLTQLGLMADRPAAAATGG